MATIAGIDYSTKAIHAAIVSEKQLRFVRRYELGNNPLPVIELALQDLEHRDVARVYMEQPFMIPARLDKETGRIIQRSNVNTLKLHRVPTQVETKADGRIAVEYVAPATWKSAILTGVPGADTKARALWFVARAHGYVTRDDNAADAICLATYGDALARFNGMLPPAYEVR